MRKTPFNVMRHAEWDRSPRVVSTFAFFTATVGLGTTAAALATAATYVAVTAVTSWAISALSPKPDFSGMAGASGSQGRLVNAKNPAAPHDFVYGQVRKGGVITYYETTGTDSKYLHQIIAIAGHEVEEIGDIYINDEVVSFSGDFVTGKWASKIRIQKFRGNQTTAPTDLLNESNQISSNFVGNGIAYLYVRYDYDQDVFANGLPMITAVVKGKKVYDPRTDTTAYSNNPALCIRDYIGAAYGMQDGDVDDVSFQAAANVCDEAVTLAGGGTEARYTMNGVFTAGTVHRDVLSQMMTSCAGTLFWGGGKFKLVASEYVAPTKVLTLDDLRSPISLDTRTNLRDQFNKVQGTFNDASNRWITADYPPITSSVFEAEDGGEQTPLDLELPMTTSGATAQRIAKLTLYRGREQMALTADFGLNALDVEVGEIVSLPFERYGWDNIAGMSAGKEFEVTGWKFGPSGDGGDLRVTLSLREISEAAFDWTAEEQDIISNNTSLLSFDDVPIPNLNAAVVTATNNADGTTIPAIDFSWTVDSDELVDYYDFQWKLSTDTAYNSATVRQKRYRISPALSGEAYDYRVRAVNALGVKSVFISSPSPVSTGDDGTIPNAPTGLAVVGGYGAATVTWTAPVANTDASAINDLFQYRVYRDASSGATTFVGRVSGEIFTDSGLADETTYYYRVKAVDFTGNEGAFSNEGSATTNASPEGARGAGRWNIGVATLPTTSSGADTDFTNAIGDPVDKDQAWFYTGTESAPTSQSVWIYDASFDLWNEQEEVIDGDLVVDGTITGNKVAASNVITNSAQIGDALITSAKIADAAITTAKIGTAEIETANIKNGAVTNRFAAFTAGAQSIGSSYVLVQSVSIDADGNPISVTFTGTMNGTVNGSLDIRLNGVSQRIYNLSGGVSPDSNFNEIWYPQTNTVNLIVTPAIGTHTITVYAKRGTYFSGPNVSNRFLQTTELKR